MMNSKRPSKSKLQAADDYHEMKEYYFEKYMSQLRDKILAYEEMPSHKTRASKRNAREDTQARLISSSSTSSRQNRKMSSRRKSSQTNPAEDTHKPLTMLDAEDRLIKEGILSSQDDLVKFRNQISTVEDLEGFVEDIITSKRNLNLGSDSSTAKRPLSKITESREKIMESREKPNSSMSAKKVVKQMDVNINPHSGNRTMKPADIARAAAAALEKRCPRMDIPNLHCLRNDSDDSDNESDIIRDHEREVYRDRYSQRVAYLRQMYQHSQANTAQAKRILDERLDTDTIVSDRQPDIIAALVSIDSSMLNRVYSPEASTTDDSTSPMPARAVTYNTELPNSIDSTSPKETTQYNRQQTFTPIKEEESAAILATNTAGLSNDVDDGVNEEKLLIPQADYLDIHSFEKSAKTLDSKALSTYWPNYLKVGKSKFAKDVS